VSYYTPSIALGGSYTFSSWNCTTTFSETGLPSNQQWYISSYDSLSSSAVSTGSQISIIQTGITTVSSYSASAKSSQLDCYSNPDITVEQGSSGTFTTWTCITTFSETGLPSGQTWQVSYNGTTNSGSTGSSISITTNNVKNAQVSYTASAKSDNLACVSYYTPSIALGGSYTFSSWNCTTTFLDSGASVGMQQFSTQWTIKFDGKRGEGVSSNEITISNNGVSNVGVYPYQQPFTQNNVLCVGSSGNAQMGSSVNLGANWKCYTMIAGNEVFSEFPLPNADYTQTVETSPGSNTKAYSGRDASSIVYNPENNLYYIALVNGDIIVVNDSTDSEVAVINPPYKDAYPLILTYANGLVFVLNEIGLGSDTVNVISGESYLSTNTSISGNDLTFQMGYNPDTNTLWIPTYTSSGTPEIAVVQANSGAALNNYLGSPWTSTSSFGGNPVYDPNNEEMYVSGMYYTALSGGNAEIAAYWASNGSCQDCTIDLSSAIGASVWTQQYIPFRVYNVGHTDFIYAGTGGSSSNKFAMLNLSNVNTIPTFTIDDDLLGSYYDGAYNSSYAFPWSWLYTLNCPQGSGGSCTSDATLYGTSTENPDSSSLSITLNNNGTTIGGVITTPVTVKFESIGLPSGTSWGVTYAGYNEGSSSQNITFAVAPGNSYSYSVPAVCSPSVGEVFTASTASPLTPPYTDTGSASAGQLVTLDWYAIGSC
ncbi:MAG: hypothetical protein ACP5MV_03390, partial [Candidatus Parvarchaeum sp.]